MSSETPGEAKKESGKAEGDSSLTLLTYVLPSLTSKEKAMQVKVCLS
jgi:hypothetical protein